MQHVCKHFAYQKQLGRGRKIEKQWETQSCPNNLIFPHASIVLGVNVLPDMLMWLVPGVQAGIIITLWYYQCGTKSFPKTLTLTEPRRKVKQVPICSLHSQKGICWYLSQTRTWGNFCGLRCKWLTITRSWSCSCSTVHGNDRTRQRERAGHLSRSLSVCMCVVRVRYKETPLWSFYRAYLPITIMFVHQTIAMSSPHSVSTGCFWKTVNCNDPAPTPLTTWFSFVSLV